MKMLFGYNNLDGTLLGNNLLPELISLIQARVGDLTALDAQISATEIHNFFRTNTYCHVLTGERSYDILHHEEEGSVIYSRVIVRTATDVSLTPNVARIVTLDDIVEFFDGVLNRKMSDRETSSDYQKCLHSSKHELAVMA